LKRRPGKQLQIDFGATTSTIGRERLRVHLFVATLGYWRQPLPGLSGMSDNRLGSTPSEVN
jgi:hypothetical protein